METVKHIASAMTPLMKKVPASFDEILQATGSTGLRQKRGCLMVFDDAEKWNGVAWQYELLEEYGFSTTELNAAETGHASERNGSEL